MSNPCHSHEDSLRLFFNGLSEGPKSFETFPINQDYQLQPNPPIPWFSFQLEDFPLEQIFLEAQRLRDRYVQHRSDQGHKGWKSLCLHGLSSTKTGCPEDYGEEDCQSLYRWTSLVEDCPFSYNFFKNQFPAESYRRIRFMVVEPGGYILPHKDRYQNYLGPLAIPLNSPKECYFGIKNHGLIPLERGRGYLVDIANDHSVWNRSKYPRYHVLVESNFGSRYKEYLKIIANSYIENFGHRKDLTSKLGLFADLLLSGPSKK